VNDPASTEFVLPVGPTAEVVAREALSRVIVGEIAPLHDRAMMLISGLLSSEDGPPVTTGSGVISLKVIPGSRSVRVEVTDSGSGVVLGGLRTARRPASGGWSPRLLSRMADRWDLVSGDEGAWVWFELDLLDGD
jgi:hypothetical protein